MEQIKRWANYACAHFINPKDAFHGLYLLMPEFQGASSTCFKAY
jgi:hypothetical protein